MTFLVCTGGLSSFSGEVVMVMSLVSSRIQCLVFLRKKVSILLLEKRERINDLLSCR